MALFKDKDELDLHISQVAAPANANGKATLEAIYQMNDAEGRAMVLLDLLSKPVAMRVDAASLRKVG